MWGKRPENDLLDTLRERNLLLEKKINQLIDFNNKLEGKLNKQEVILSAIINKGYDNADDAKKEFFLSIPPAAGTLRKVQIACEILLRSFDKICRDNQIPYWISFGTLLGALRHKDFIPWDDDTDVGMLRDDIEKLKLALEGNPDFYLKEFFTVPTKKPYFFHHNYQFHFIEENTPYSLDIFVYDKTEYEPHEIKPRHDALRSKLISNAEPIITKYTKGEGPVELHFEEEFFSYFNQYLEEQKELLGNAENAKSIIYGIDNVQARRALASTTRIDDIFPLIELPFGNRMYCAPNKADKYCEKLYGDYYTLPDDIYTGLHFVIDEPKLNILNSIIKKHHMESAT